MKLGAQILLIPSMGRREAAVSGGAGRRGASKSGGYLGEGILEGAYSE